MSERWLCSMPGRVGDIAWACACLREISATLGAPVDLQICGEFGGMVPLLEQQSYIANVLPDDRWSMGDGWESPLPKPGWGRYDRVVRLGYHRWPELPLPQEIWQTAQAALPAIPSLDLTRPWLTVRDAGFCIPIVAGFTDCWFELKLGVLALLEKAFPKQLLLCCPPGSRWATEVPNGLIHRFSSTLLDAAHAIRGVKVFLGDCSALHVMAVGLGVPCVLYEPMEARLNPVFWPLGQDGPQVTLIKGGDGKATIDARHTRDALEAALARRQEVAR